MRHFGGLAAALIILLLVSLCSLRLNDSILLDPDGTEFLLLARSLATFQGYRDISQPGWPPHTLRPPGCSILLLPAAWLAPYSVVAAKIIVILLAAVMLFLLWRLGVQVLGAVAGLAVLLLAGTSPATLWYGSDLCSEVPYTACTLGAVLAAALWVYPGVSRKDQAGSTWTRTRLTVAYTLLAFAPLIRLLGLCLTAAAIPLAVRADASRSKGTGRWSFRWWGVLFLLATLLPVVVWLVFSSLVANRGTTYATLFARPRAGGAFAWTLGNLAFYADSLVAYVFSDLPKHVGIILLVLPAAGMLMERRGLGGPVLIYCVLYLIVISFYPFRHPRLAWPLVPFAYVWGARAIQVGLYAWGNRVALGRLTGWVMLGAIGIWTGWQLTVCVHWVVANWSNEQSAKLGWSHLAPMRVPDWPRAGRWLATNSASYERALTREKSLFLWSCRDQIQVQFEGISATELDNAIRSARAHFLVMAYTDEGVSVPMERLASDPMYRFDLVYLAGNVAVYKISANRTGTVLDSPVDFSAVLRRLETESAGAVEANSRDYLRGHFLRRSGRAADALPILETLAAQDSQNLTVELELAACLIDVGSFGEALQRYRRAEQMMGANRYANAIQAGVMIAGQFERFHDQHLPGAQRAAAGLVIAEGHLQMGRYHAALGLLDECLSIAPLEPSCLYVKGCTLQRLGRDTEAIDAFEAAVQRGVREALPKLLLLQTAQALEGSEPVELVAAGRRYVVDPQKSEDHLNLAKLAIRDGIAGFALTTMERAERLFPNDPAVHDKLGELHELFGEWPLALAAWSRAEEIQPDPQRSARMEDLRAKLVPRTCP